MPAAFTLCLAASAAADAAPRILAAAAKPTVVRNGDSVSWDVRTTPEVVSVDARVSFYDLRLVRRGPGRFGIVLYIPPGVPFFFHRQYQVTVTARDADGSTDSRSFSMSFQ
ncbi:MAG: hypothetical protein ACLPSH_06435 [Vulcanimicrobiaceae bacterium]